MPFGEHIVTCVKCRKRFICGDCIYLECFECRYPEFSSSGSETVYEAVRGVIMQEADLPDRSAKPRSDDETQIKQLSPKTIRRIRYWTQVYKTHIGNRPGDAAWRRFAESRVLDILSEAK